MIKFIFYWHPNLLLVKFTLCYFLTTCFIPNLLVLRFFMFWHLKITKLSQLKFESETAFELIFFTVPKFCNKFVDVKKASHENTCAKQLCFTDFFIEYTYFSGKKFGPPQSILIPYGHGYKHSLYPKRKH